MRLHPTPEDGLWRRSQEHGPAHKTAITELILPPCCLWCGNPQHYLKICPHRQKLHPDWSPDFLKKCIKFPSKKGVPTKDVQYYCASIIASQMSGTEPKLNLQQNSQPRSDLGARSIKVNSQSVSDFADFAALDPMRALQRNTTTTTSPIATSTGETNDE